jgi:hypothetical protein
LETIKKQALKTRKIARIVWGLPIDEAAADEIEATGAFGAVFL